MKVDARLTVEGDRHKQTEQISRLAEDLGLGAVWSGENKHDAFLPLAVAANCTERLQVGTAVAIAFSRSPMVVAQLAWDLQRRSDGRFLLGLGTQVRAHITRRFSMPWDKPASRLKDYVLALRAIWDTFQHDTKLAYSGEFYSHTLMAPTFNPGPISHPHIPVFVSGVGAAMAQSAGGYADGFHVHPFHSAEYVREVLRPALDAGARDAGRSIDDMELSASAFIITGNSTEEVDREREDVRSRIAFYASTPSYRAVLEVHGWEAIGEKLSVLAREGRWAELPSLVPDDMLAAFAIEGAPSEIGAQLRARYEGVLDRISLFDFLVPEREDLWRDIMRASNG